jgi:hypothetical protein
LGAYAQAGQDDSSPAFFAVFREYFVPRCHNGRILPVRLYRRARIDPIEQLYSNVGKNKKTMTNAEDGFLTVQTETPEQDAQEKSGLMKPGNSDLAPANPIPC